MRTGWAPDAVWALLDAGHFGYGHQHEDKLSLLLHAYGRLLLTEGGNYAYDASEMRRYVLSTRAHNTVRVDGEDQNRRLAFSRERFDVSIPSDGSLRITPTHDVAAGVYDEGYGPDAARMAAHRRTVIFLKQSNPLPGPCAIVIDRLIPSDAAPHTYQFLWHLNANSVETDGLAVRSVDPDQPNLTILPTARPGSLSVRVAHGEETPEFQGWRAIKNHQQGDFAPTPTAIYEWTVVGPARLVTLLFPVRPGEACPVAAVNASSATASTEIQVLLADGRTVLLNENEL